MKEEKDTPKVNLETDTIEVKAEIFKLGDRTGLCKDYTVTRRYGL